jgi:3-oxoadipate enol-lactonase
MDYVLVDGIRLACRLDGHADLPALIFINSLGCDLRMWDNQAAALSPLFRIVRYDMRGHGRSDVPSEPATMEQLGQDLLAVLDHFQIHRVSVCGISLGGMVALWLAALHPERVDHAVFANTAARIGSDESWSARIELVRAGGMAAVRDMVLSRFLSERFRALRPDLAVKLGSMLEATNPLGYIAACAALRDADLRDLVPRIRVPSLIIAGELDESTPPEQAAELQEAIRGSELVMIKAAHLSNIEQPQLFNASLRAALTAA